MLRTGSRGSDVTALQQKLAAAGFNPGGADGVFGPRTSAAVVAYQRAHHLGADGVVGKNTSHELFGDWNTDRFDGVDGAGGGAPPRPAPGGGAQATGYVNGRATSIALAPVGNGKFLRSDAAASYLNMQAAARRAGVSLSSISGFRTMAEQQDLYRRYLNGTGNKAARPGYSNHQSGISMDIGNTGGYGGTGYRWLQANARRFGFVNDVSGEPWHWTYRG